MPRARILAVDDQRYFRELIEGLLSEEGYEVQTASSGEEALHVMERDDFDIVVTDLVMPGMDGCELVQRVKERDAEQEIVMVTGVVDVKTAVEAMKQGATDYILKPFDRRALVGSLERILQRRRLRDEHARLMAENLEYMSVLSLYERAAGLFSTLALEPLAERLIEGLCLETRAQGGVLWVAHDLGDERLTLAAARGLIRVEEEPEELRLEHLGPELRPLVDDKASIILPWRDDDGQSTPSALYVPLHHAGHLIGIARLTDKLEGGEFVDPDRASADKFVSYGAGAVANALRFRSLERRSFRDPGTKAYSAEFFQDLLRNEVQKANRFNRRCSLLRIEVAALGELRRQTSDPEFQAWLEQVVGAVAGVLRATDLLSVQGESSFQVLMPETDAIGASILKQRLRHAIESSGFFRTIDREVRPQINLAAATYPTDGTQIESLERVLDVRLREHRESLVRTLDLEDRPFVETIEMLVEGAVPGTPRMPAQVTRLLFDEIRRRPKDRGMLVLSPGSRLGSAVELGLTQLFGGGASRGAESAVAVVGKGGPASGNGEGPSWIDPSRLGTHLPFVLYYGEGPAYAMVSADGPETEAAPLFHTSDRALVEHLAFRLQRDLDLELWA